MLHVQMPIFFFLGALCYLFPWILKSFLCVYVALILLSFIRSV